MVYRFVGSLIFVCVCVCLRVEDACCIHACVGQVLARTLVNLSWCATPHDCDVCGIFVVAALPQGSNSSLIELLCVHCSRRSYSAIAASIVLVLASCPYLHRLEERNLHSAHCLHDRARRILTSERILHSASGAREESRRIAVIAFSAGGSACSGCGCTCGIRGCRTASSTTTSTPLRVAPHTGVPERGSGAPV